MVEPTDGDRDVTGRHSGPNEQSPDWIALLPAALWLSTVMTALFVIVHQLYAALPSYPHLLAQAIFANVPMGMFELFIGLLGKAAKPTAFFGCILLTIGGGGVLTAAAGARTHGRQVGDRRRFRRLLTGLVVTVSVPLALFTLLVVYPLGGIGAWGLAAVAPAVALIAALVGPLLLGLGAAALAARAARLGRPLPGEEDADGAREAPAAAAPLSRRQWLTSAAGWVAAAAVLFFLDRLRLFGPLTESDAGPQGTLDGAGADPAPERVSPRRPGYPQAVTPQEDFYQVSKNLSPPAVSLDEWSLRVEGLVSEPYSLSYQDLRQLPAREEMATLICVSNPIGGDLISNARWTGVGLAELLERAGETGEAAVDVVFHAADGYSDSIPLEKAVAPETMLTYEMNGEQLTAAHGFPARIVVPGIYGMKSCKWIEAIEVVDHDYKGYWQRREWSDEAVVKTMSRIDRPQPRARIERGQTLRVAGIAFAGVRGIDGVKVHLGRMAEPPEEAEGPWEQAVLEPEFAPNAWRFWTYEWTPREAGRYQLAARATDGTGTPQTTERSPVLPAGAAGLHTITVRVA